MGHSTSKHYVQNPSAQFNEQVNLYVLQSEQSKRYNQAKIQIPRSDTRQPTFEPLTGKFSSFQNIPNPSQDILVQSLVEHANKSEIRQCLKFVSNSMTSQSALQVNGSIIDPVLSTLNHPYADPDVTHWGIMDMNILSRIPFERMKKERRFQLGVSNTPHLTEVNIASLVKQYGIDDNTQNSIIIASQTSNNRVSNLKLNLSCLSSRSKLLRDEIVQTERTERTEHQKAQSPMHNKFFFLQKNENFTDIDDYLNTIESDIPKYQSSNGSHVFDKDLDQKFRHNESIQQINDSKAGSLRSLSQQVQVQMRQNNPLNRQKIHDKDQYESMIRTEKEFRSQIGISKDQYQQTFIDEDVKKIKSTRKSIQKKNSFETDDESIKNQQIKQYQGQIITKPFQNSYITGNKVLKNSTVQKTVPVVSQKANVKFYGSLKQQVLQQKEQQQTKIQAIEPKIQVSEPKIQKEEKTIITRIDNRQKDPQHNPVNQSNYLDVTYKNDLASSRYNNLPAIIPYHQNKNIPEIQNLQESRKEYQKTTSQRQESLNKLQSKIDQILIDSSEKKEKLNDSQRKNAHKPYPQQKDLELSYVQQQLYQETIEREVNSRQLKDIKSDIDRLSDKINLTISPSFNNDKDQQISQQRFYQEKSSTLSKGQKYTHQKEDEDYDNLPDFQEPAVIQFSWDQLQNYKKK